jgi:antitoxin (DNA-binding transcriptional repressor) of toxin-antitoxin stability system
MEVSITEFRRDLFTLVNLAMQGEEIWVAHRGSRFRIAPDRASVSAASLPSTSSIPRLRAWTILLSRKRWSVRGPGIGPTCEWLAL